MAKFVDKQNLAQYKYFNNLVGKDDIVKDIASNYIVGDHQLSNRLVQNNPREYRDSKDIATFILNRDEQFIRPMGGGKINLDKAVRGGVDLESHADGHEYDYKIV